LHEQIIGEGLYKNVQRVLDARIAKKIKSHPALFRNYAHCHECENRLLAEHQKGHTYYRCHSKDHTAMVREDRLETALQQHLALHPIDEVTSVV